MTNILKLLIEISAMSGIMIIIVMGLRAIFAKKMSPGIITLLWAMVLLRLVLPFTLQSPVQIAQLMPEKPVMEAQSFTEKTSVAYEEQGATAFLQPNVYSEATQTQSTLAETMSVQTEPTFLQRLGTIIRGISLESVLAGTWVMGALAFVLLTLWRAMLYKRKLNNCERVTDGKIIEMVKEYKQSLGIKRRVFITLCNDGEVPAVFGYFRPHIVLPASFVSNTDKATLSCILLHELCHVKRHDILKSYVWLIAKAIHWFNPLVWIAYKMLKDDMELCCDQMVVNELGDKRFEYTQSLIDVFRHAKQNKALVVTLSLFENRIKLIDRVMRMLKPEKKSKFGFAITIILILVMALACFTTACHPVTNSEETAAVEEATATPEQVMQTQTPEAEVANTQKPQEQGEEPLANYSVAGRWTDSVEREDSIIKLNIDADIVMPDVDTANTYYVNPIGVITQEMTDKILEVLFGDAPLYEYQERTGESYQKEIDQMNNIYQSMLDGTFDFSNYLSEEEVIKSAEEHIAQLEKNMKDAPELVERIPMNTMLNYGEYDDATIRGVTDPGSENMAQIIISNSKYGSTLIFCGDEQDYWPLEVYGEVPAANLKITTQEAINTAEKFLDDIGLNDFQLFDNFIVQGQTSYFDQGTGKYAHMLKYTRVVDCIEASQNAHMPALDSRSCNNEKLAIAINDDGICRIDWQHGFALEQQASQAEKLLPIEEIEKVIADKMFIEEPIISNMNEKDMGIQGFEVQEYTYNIDQVRLEYMKLPYGNDLEDIRLIPVWSVFATIENKYTKDENGERVEGVIDSGRSGAVLTINAIDASLIDKELWANRDFY